MNTAEFKAHLLSLFTTLLVAGAFLATDKPAGVANALSLTLLLFVGASRWHCHPGPYNSSYTAVDTCDHHAAEEQQSGA